MPAFRSQLSFARRRWYAYAWHPLCFLDREQAMPTGTLQQVAEAVVRRAQRQGFVVPREVRAELRLAGLAEDQWKEAIELVRPELIYRQGRYHHTPRVRP